MKKIFTSTIILMALTACTTFRVQTSDSAGTENPPPNMPNPATLYCEQNGNTSEIRIAADGSQSGECVFPNGSTCDEWAYFRGECGPSASGGGPGGSGGTDGDGSGGYMPPGSSEEISDWWGVIKSAAPGTQYDDYFERQDLGQILYFGIDSLDPALKSQIEALRDSGKIVHLYGTVLSNVPDFNSSQIQVDRIQVAEQGAGSLTPPGVTEEIFDWWGVIKSTEPGAQFDDYFERQDFTQIITFGIDSRDPALKSQIEALRDSGKIVHLYGTLLSNVPDYNGSQIQVDRIQVDG
jgi:putative hemolysin